MFTYLVAAVLVVWSVGAFAAIARSRRRFRELERAVPGLAAQRRSSLLADAVPPLVALSLVATTIYLAVASQGKPEYEVPDVVTIMLTLMLGYFVGAKVTRD